MKESHSDYNNMQDDELITAFKDGDSGAAEYLLDKYKYIVKWAKLI